MLDVLAMVGRCHVNLSLLSQDLGSLRTGSISVERLHSESAKSQYRTISKNVTVPWPSKQSSSRAVLPVTKKKKVNGYCLDSVQKALRQTMYFAHVQLFLATYPTIAWVFVT
jgi:hypothetical protein